jgi:hypothetical protein
MLAYGQSNELLQPDRGERQFNRILETLAVLRAEGDVPLSDMLYAESHLFPRGTTIIAVTPFAREEWSVAARQLRGAACAWSPSWSIRRRSTAAPRRGRSTSSCAPAARSPTSSTTATT